MISDLERHMAQISAKMILVAKRYPWNGRENVQGQRILSRCRHLDRRTGASLLFTFDHGHHACGWWKNPDFERCFHLSIAELGLIIESAGYDASEIPQLTRAAREAWVHAFFEDTENLVWTEPPTSDTGKMISSWHYRVFVDSNGIPILPRGEVYSRELTEAGWLSWSDARAAESEEDEEISPGSHER